MGSIEYLDKIMSTAFSLRKVLKLQLEQRTGIHSIRPQLHIMIISPFGTGKSSVTSNLQEKYPKEVMLVDEFSKASLYGSISKTGEYIASSLLEAGGKVMIVDEWNNVSNQAQSGILSVLENQRLSKTLGFKVNKTFKKKNKFCDYSIVGSKIMGKINFSCIAYAMIRPTIYNSIGRPDRQKTLALFSRFSPIYIDPDKELMNDVRMGEFTIDIEDNSKEFEQIIIEKECYTTAHEMFSKYLEENNLYPPNTNDYGIINRVWTDIIRYSIHSAMKDATSTKTLTINNVKYFKENMIYTETILNQFYTRPENVGSSKYENFKKIIKHSKDTNIEVIAKQASISVSQAYRYKKTYEQDNWQEK